MFRFEQHLVIGIVRDCAARGQRGDPRPAPAADHAVDRVVVNEGAAPAAAGTEPLGQHFDDRGEIFAWQLAVRPGAPHQREEVVLAPFLRRALGDDLLRQHIERLLGKFEPI